MRHLKAHIVFAACVALAVFALASCAPSQGSSALSETGQSECAWVTGDYAASEADDSCLACHQDGTEGFSLTWDQIKEATANYMGHENCNPHDSHLNSDGVQCSACHQEGHDLQLACSNCHFF